MKKWLFVVAVVLMGACSAVEDPEALDEPISSESSALDNGPGGWHYCSSSCTTWHMNDYSLCNMFSAEDETCYDRADSRAWECQAACSVYL
jgi:hypothetical protein